MELNDLFSHLNSISSSIQTHWNFFSVVVLGIATGLAIKDKKIDKLVGIFLVLGLGMFMVSNFYRISQATEELNIVEREIKSLVASGNVTLDFKTFYTNYNSRANKLWCVFHIVIDIFLLLVIIYRTEWRKKASKVIRLE